MDFRVREYLSKLFNDEYEKTLEKRMFNLGVAWGYFALAESVARSCGEKDKELLCKLLSDMQDDENIGEYIKEILDITQKEMTPTDKLKQSLERRYHK